MAYEDTLYHSRQPMNLTDLDDIASAAGWEQFEPSFDTPDPDDCETVYYERGRSQFEATPEDDGFICIRFYGPCDLGEGEAQFICDRDAGYDDYWSKRFGEGD